MRRWLTLLAAGAAIAIAGFACASNPRPVPLDASPADWELLTGRWLGDYTITASPRQGTIEFRLAAGADQASGDVLMFPAKGARPYGPYRHNSPEQGPEPGAAAQLLTIRFVRAADGRLSGALAPYWDPDRECQARATFAGEMKGQVIEGTFVTTCEDGVRQLNGRWKVTRRPSR